MNWYKKSQSGIRLWLDDERDPKNPQIQRDFGSTGNEVWVKTQNEAIQQIQNNNVMSISFDNDLGEPESEKGSGYGLAKWIEEKAFFGEIKRMEWYIHSKNNVADKYILMAMQKAEEFWNNNENNPI